MSRRSVLPPDPVITTIQDLTHEGYGVAKVDGKTVFIAGTLPGEEVEFQYRVRKRNFDEGKLLRILKTSADRIEPRCPHFAVCGGCNLQHLSPEKQLEFKQKLMLDNLTRLGHVTPLVVAAPVSGSPWGYRRKARLGVKYVTKKEKLMVGFRERDSHFLADLSRCEILAPEVGLQLTTLSNLLRSLSCYQHIPQVEVAVGDNATALVIRHMQPLTEQDTTQLTEFAQQHGYHIYLQPKGLSSIAPLWPLDSALSYRVDNNSIELLFAPTDFVQVNRFVNLAMIDKVVAALNLNSATQVLELFSGLGNFTLPIAKRAGRVVAVEGERSLVQRAQDNAVHNQISNVQHYVSDLTKDVSIFPWFNEKYDRIFLDPPRSGAAELMPLLAAKKTERIVYVSCNPATLARDADILVNQFQYQLSEVAILDMFPHTAHVEVLAIFDRV